MGKTHAAWLYGDVQPAVRLCEAGLCRHVNLKFLIRRGCGSKLLIVASPCCAACILLQPADANGRMPCAVRSTRR